MGVKQLTQLLRKQTAGKNQAKLLQTLSYIRIKDRPLNAQAKKSKNRYGRLSQAS